MNLITIIVTVYNKEKYLEKCLESIYSSSCLNFDLIVVNDGSTDNSKKILDDYKKKSKVRIYHNNNQGLSFSKNFAVSKVKTKYFLFVDADDFIEKDLIRKMDKIILKQDIDLIAFNLIKIKEGKIVEKIQKPSFDCLKGEEAIYKYITSKKTFDPSTIYIYNKQYYTDNKFNFPLEKYHEDFATTPLIILNAKKMVSLDYYGYYYVQTEDSIMRNNDYEKEKRKAFDILFHYDNLYKHISEGNYKKKTKDIFNIYIFQALVNKLSLLNKKDRSELKKQIRIRKVYKRLPNDNLKGKIKNITLLIDPLLYLKITKIGS